MDKNGFIVLDKPEDMSSFLAVKLVKKALNAKKAGHMGTLDPMATGVLVIGINKGTKHFEQALKSPKEYYAEYCFGHETDTLDKTGVKIKENQVIVTSEMLQKILPNFLGKINQIPPNYSAKKIDGKRAYELARKGEEFELPSKEVEVYDLQLIKQTAPNTFCLKIQCSSGFYVRSLGRDLAKYFSTYCTTLNIKRTKCCGYDIKQANQLEDIKNQKYNFFEI